MAKRVVVVGAGPGGLAAALQLRHAGLDVTILERQDHVGGRTSSFGGNGFTFDCGPTFFLYPQVLTEIFASLGRDLAADVPMQRLDPQYRLSFGAGGRLDCTGDLDEMDRQITALSPADKGAVRRFMDDNRVKLRRFRPILQSPFESPAHLLRPQVLAAAPLVRPWWSLGRELQRYFVDPRLVIAFSFQAKYLGMSPFRCPSLFSILSFMEYEHGVWHPLGGCGQVSTRMAEIARQQGVTIRLKEPVRGFEFRGRRVTAAVTGRGRYEADAVVVNADFAAAMQKLVPDRLRRRWSDRRIARKKFSCSTFMLYLGIRGRYENFAHHTIHIAKNYEQNLAEIDQQHVLSDDPSLYIHNPSIIDPSLAPPGHSSLYVLVPVSHMHDNIDWTTAQASYREKVLDKLESLGMPDIRKRIVWEHVITPRDWQEGYAIYRGATFNLAHTLGQMLHQRPRNRFEEIDGMYLVGGGTHPGSGLPVIYESSRITSRLLLRDLQINSDFIDAPAGPRAASISPPLETPEPVIV